MPKDYSPFTPGQPVSVEFFVGRSKEIGQLKDKAVQAANRGLQVAFLSGERGIGKSSLASFVKFLAARDDRILGLHTFLGGVSSLEGMVRKVFNHLFEESIDKTWHRQIREYLGNHIKEVGLFGVRVEFGAPEKDLRRMVHDFAPALRNLIQRLKGDKRGILLVLDDINGLAESLDFANWLKSLVDEIATSSEPLPLCLVLVGLEERRHSLVSLQPSLARVFEVIEIKAWSPEETREFFRNAFSEVSVSIDDDALDFLSWVTGGLPVLAHELGEATFKQDSDNRIDIRDAEQGIVEAAVIVGHKHLEPRVFDAIRSTRYRAILRKVAAQPFEFRFKRADLRARLASEEQKVLDNFLRRMQQLNVIRPDSDGGPGTYQFENHLYSVYFRLEATRAKKTKEL